MKFIFEKFKKIIFLFILLSLTQVLTINEIEIASTRKWCWTKPVINDPSFILNPNNGGINWGYCKPGNSATNKIKEYYVYISTSTRPDSETTSTINISLKGTETTTKEIVLSSGGFKSGSYERIKIFAEDVGNLQSIRLVNKGKDSYQCNTIKIESEMNYWNFECNKPLQCPQMCGRDLHVVNMITYDVTVKTSTTDDSGTSVPIYIVIWGTKGKTPIKLLADRGFPAGSLVQASTETMDVDVVYGITLYLDGNDNWLPEEIIVKKLSPTGQTLEKVFKNNLNIALTSWEKSLTIKLSPPDTTRDDDAAPSANSNALLDNKDQARVIQLSCTKTMRDNEDFGPTYVTNNVNYMVFLAECPHDCMRIPMKAVGFGIHPEESPICINALVDRAISYYGGTIAVSIYKGLPSYTGGKKMFGIPVTGYGNSKRSYTIARVDNIDMIANDIRIIDSEGKPSFKGRVEIRNEGIWGTICAAGLENSAAKLICKKIGYKEGKFLNPNENKGRDYCSNYEGANYCGVEAAPIFFSHLICQGNEDKLTDCYRKMADKSFCTHKYDALIECGNTDTEDYVTFNANTIRLMDSTNNPTQTGIGRVEILKGNWGSLCNTKFTDHGAQVVCKQMGYLDGHLYGQAESANMCNNVLGNNLCGDFSQPIKLTEVICTGHEKSIKDCKSNDNTVSCSKFNDVIVKCEGYGDSSGKSQNIKRPVVLNPLIEKLPMPPTYNAKCDSTAKNLAFRGDPGSIYLVNCPGDCATTNFSITGTGVYSIDSSICRAALQSGVITSEGGNIALIKSYGQNKFYGSTLRNISSLESNYIKVSFYLSAINSAYTNMISMFNNGMFLEMGVNEKLSSEYNSPISVGHKNFIKYLQYSSFLESANAVGEVKAAYVWTSPNHETRFDGSTTYQDLYIVEEAKKILNMKTFTVYMNIKMQEFNNKPQTIISVGGCEGFSISIDPKNELIFDVKCGSLSYKSGIYVPVNFDSHLTIVYDGSKIIYYLEGNKQSEINSYFNLHYKPKITLGRSSEYNADFFNGKIDYIVFYSQALGPKSVNNIFKNGYRAPDKLKVPKYITLDNRPCITSCANLATPGIAGSPKAPPEATIFELNGDKQVIPSSSGGSSSGGENNLSPFIEVKCTTTAREVFKGDIKVGDKIRIKCPQDCKKPKGIIYGTIIYSFDSLACYSAVHSGIIKSNESSMILIKALPGMTFYQGTLQYNVQSASIDKSDYSFSAEQAPPVILIDCKTTASVPQFAGTLGMKFLVRCPEKCSKIPHNVFGKGLYSGDSSICQSSIHAGALNDHGGEVQFMIEPGKKLYFGEKVFGIDSKERDSYVKSIRFFNANNNLFVKFQEDFKNQFVTKNWDIVDNFEANDYPSKWEFVPTPSNIKSTSKFLIHQAKKIKSEQTLTYGSILNLKNVDIVNSLFKSSYFFVNLAPVGIIFRYKDENNYYHLRLNNVGSFKIILVKRFEGKSTVLATSNISITPRIWYTFTLQIFYDKFQVFLQIGDLRNNQLIFETIDNDIQRGSLGIGADGNDDFYVNGVFVDNFELNKTNMKSKTAADFRSFENLLRENTNNHRMKFCKSLFEKNADLILECREFHNYCKFRCDEMVHKRENVLNFSCYKACLKDSIMKDKISNMQMNEEVSYGLNSDAWSPKEKDKCDFKPDNVGAGSFWVPAFVSGVTSNPNDPEQKFVEIKYMVGSKTKITKVLYPSITLKKCGSMLKVRDDCNKTANELPVIPS